MEIIRNYLETAFATLPQTPETLRLKEEMAANMEEKYMALKEEGKSENEAVGIVITEFGNIEELASEMNIQINNMPVTQNLRTVSMDDAESFLSTVHKTSLIDSIAVSICILAAATLIAVLAVFQTSEVAPIVGVACLLTMVAIAVGLFVYTDNLESSWAFLKKEVFQITPSTAIQVKTKQESYKKRSLPINIISIMLYVLAPAWLMLTIALVNIYNKNDALILWGVVGLLILVAIATFGVILTSSRKESYKILLQEDDYTPENKEIKNHSGVIAAIWWPITTAIFLAWGFLGNGGFAISWVVWPISGVLFGAIMALYNAIITVEK